METHPISGIVLQTFKMVRSLWHILCTLAAAGFNLIQIDWSDAPATNDIVWQRGRKVDFF